MNKLLLDIPESPGLMTQEELEEHGGGPPIARSLQVVRQGKGYSPRVWEQTEACNKSKPRKEPGRRSLVQVRPRRR